MKNKLPPSNIYCYPVEVVSYRSQKLPFLFKNCSNLFNNVRKRCQCLLIKLYTVAKRLEKLRGIEVNNNGFDSQSGPSINMIYKYEIYRKECQLTVFSHLLKVVRRKNIKKKQALLYFLLYYVIIIRKELSASRGHYSETASSLRRLWPPMLTPLK